MFRICGGPDVFYVTTNGVQEMSTVFLLWLTCSKSFVVRFVSPNHIQIKCFTTVGRLSTSMVSNIQEFQLVRTHLDFYTLGFIFSFAISPQLSGRRYCWGSWGIEVYLRKSMSGICGLGDLILFLKSCD